MTIESIKSIEGVEKGKDGMNPDKMKWDYKLRNIILAASIFFNVLLFLIEPQGYFESLLYLLPSGVPLNFIFAAFYMYSFWKYMNSAKEENPSPARTDISGWILIVFLFSSSIYMIFTGKALPFPLDFILNAFFSTGFIVGLIMYPLILYWERKNMMTIYFVEEKPSKLRLVAIPDQVLQLWEKIAI
jgi:hypothetical protein